MTMSRFWVPPMTTGASAGLTSSAASIMGRPLSSARSSPAVRTDGACAGSQSISTSNELPAHEHSGVGHGRGHRRPSERCSTGTCIAERLCGIRAGSAIGGAGPDNKPGPRQSGVRVQAPHLQMVTTGLWKAAHTRLKGARAIYLRGTQGQLWGRPTDGVESKYLLTGLARCGVCGGSLVVRSRSHGGRRAFFYGCTSYHHRGRTVCTNTLEMPMLAADEAVLESAGG